MKSRVFDTYAQLRIGFKRKLGRYKSSVPSSITNIDLNHKDRPRYSIVGARLIVQFLLSSFRCQPLPLCLFLSFHSFSSFFLSLAFLFLLLCFSFLFLFVFFFLFFFSFSSGNDLSIHLFRAVYVPLVAFPRDENGDRGERELRRSRL